MEKTWAAAVALMTLLIIAGCEAEAPPQVAVRTLTRVASPSGRFEAVLKRIDPGTGDPATFTYHLLVVPNGGDGGSTPVAELRNLDLQSPAPVAIEWQGDAKLVLTYGAAEVSGHQPSAEVTDSAGKPQSIEVVVEPSRPAE